MLCKHLILKDHFIHNFPNFPREDGFKLKEGKFRLDIRKKSFTVKVMRHWNGLPREVVDALSPKTFEVSLDWALSNLI